MNQIPAISLWQPWASLVAHGLKQVETRSWPFRGQIPSVLAIHATRTWNEDVLDAFVSGDDDWKTMREHLARCGYGKAGDLPLGGVIALTTVEEVRQTETLTPTDQERAFGDFRPGRWGWILGSVARFRVQPCRGAMRIWIWNVPEGLQPIVDVLRRDLEWRGVES